MSGKPNRSGGRRSLVNVPVDTLDLEAIRAEAERSAENLVAAPEPADHWHPTASNLYEAAMDSQVRVLWEPSDWAMMYLLAEDLSRSLSPTFVGMRKTGLGLEDEPHYEEQPLPAAKIGAYRAAFNDLLLSVEARRKANFEVDRKAAPLDENQDMIEDAKLDRLRLVQGG